MEIILPTVAVVVTSISLAVLLVMRIGDQLEERRNSHV